MNARGTRRPHMRRAYKKPRKSGGGGKKTGCSLVLLAMLAVLPLADAVWGWLR